jgi:hypothetical protein
MYVIGGRSSFHRCREAVPRPLKPSFLAGVGVLHTVVLWPRWSGASVSNHIMVEEFVDRGVSIDDLRRELIDRIQADLDANLRRLRQIGVCLPARKWALLVETLAWLVALLQTFIKWRPAAPMPWLAMPRTRGPSCSTQCVVGHDLSLPDTCGLVSWRLRQLSPPPPAGVAGSPGVHWTSRRALPRR